jgi:hypothetical protein
LRQVLVTFLHRQVTIQMYPVIILDISLNMDHDLILYVGIAPKTNHNLIATKELVLETSHDFNPNLYLGIAPRAQS